MSAQGEESDKPNDGQKKQLFVLIKLGVIGPDWVDPESFH